MELISSKELKEFALQKLTGRWFTAMVVSVVAVILGIDNSLRGAISSVTNSDETIRNISERFIAFVTGEIPSYVIDTTHLAEIIPIGLISGIAAAVVVWRVVAFVFGGAINLGYCLFHIGVCRDENVSFGTLFSRFGKFFKAFGLNFMIRLFIMMWWSLFIIPGIVASYRYAMATYIMAENPDIGIFEALDASKKMMKGFKSDLFWMHFSFLGWVVLCTLTLGLGFIVLRPYMATAEAAFYLQLKGRVKSEPEILMQ